MTSRPSTEESEMPERKLYHVYKRRGGWTRMDRVVEGEFGNPRVCIPELISPVHSVHLSDVDFNRPPETAYTRRDFYLDGVKVVEPKRPGLARREYAYYKEC